MGDIEPTGIMPPPAHITVFKSDAQPFILGAANQGSPDFLKCVNGIRYRDARQRAGETDEQIRLKQGSTVDQAQPVRLRL